VREEEAAATSNYLRFSSLVVGGLGRKRKKGVRMNDPRSALPL
jgi:hypothetical protein